MLIANFYLKTELKWDKTINGVQRKDLVNGAFRRVEEGLIERSLKALKVIKQNKGDEKC